MSEIHSIDSNYETVRRRLRSGYGAHIEDKGIDLKKATRVNDAPAGRPLSMREQALHDQVTFLKAKIFSIEKNYVNCVNRLELIEQSLRLHQAMTSIGKKTWPMAVAVSQIIDLVSQHEGIGYHGIVGGNRTAPYCRCRAIISYLALKFTQSTVVGIARMLGGRDHSTIVKSMQALEQRRKANPEYDAKIIGYERMMQELTAPAEQA